MHLLSVHAPLSVTSTAASVAVESLKGGSAVSVRLNNGDGTFAPKVDHPTDPFPLSVAAADLNGDGKPDLAVANNDSYSVGVMLNACLP